MPLGVLIGTLMDFWLEGRALLVMKAFFIGIASGVFLYVAVVDVLLVEFMDPFDKYPKFVLFLLGWGLTVCML
eukprot:CAMPEP_0177670898 /NCGR_PEP_ID=MMETSP0447-20121125/24363_1 /TAXON_ID=0 /ORGANISM="Stygamoeba regulata, Strain BSH-02190019" /LENGTH=72 /DNA_ID=CAMNT_0019178149 /DNA_START=22 /DNA_END=237 /DNA_ORIENTATION=+